MTLGVVFTGTTVTEGSCMMRGAQRLRQSIPSSLPFFRRAVRFFAMDASSFSFHTSVSVNVEASVKLKMRTSKSGHHLHQARLRDGGTRIERPARCRAVLECNDRVRRDHHTEAFAIDHLGLLEHVDVSLHVVVLVVVGRLLVGGHSSASTTRDVSVWHVEQKTTRQIHESTQEYCGHEDRHVLLSTTKHLATGKSRV